MTVIVTLIVLGLVLAAVLVIGLLHRKERQGHRVSATNCRFYYGDNKFADWGRCVRCEP